MLKSTNVEQLAKEVNPVYRALKSNSTFETCSRCSGEGDLFQYKGIKNGVCFKCWGRKESPKNQAAKAMTLINRNFQYLNNINFKRPIADITTFNEFKKINQAISKLPKKYIKLLEQLP